MNNKISFLHIKENSKKCIYDCLMENTFKIAKNNNSDVFTKLSEDIILETEDYIKILSDEEPIVYINNFFAEVNKTSKSDQQYDILSYDKVITSNGSYYNLILSNSLLNSIGNIGKMPNDERVKKSNVISSALAKYYANSVALFGDIFIIRIDSSYYELLCKLNDNETKNETEIKNINSQLSTYTKIYYDFKIRDFIDSFTNVNYIKIFSQETNNVVIYSREILNAFIQNPKTDYNILGELNMITIHHNNMNIFVKYTEPFINSQNHIMKMVSNSNNNSNDDHSLYFVNISNDDIEIILNKNNKFINYIKV